MKRCKRIISMLLICCMVVAMLPATVNAANKTDIAYAVTGGNIYFDSFGTLTSCDDTVTAVVIPEEIDGIIVDYIGFEHFTIVLTLQPSQFPKAWMILAQKRFITVVALQTLQFQKM